MDICLGLEAEFVGMVDGIGGAGGGAPGISGLSDEICVTLDGVVNVTAGTPRPELPEQPASSSNPAILPPARDTCASMVFAPIRHCSGNEAWLKGPMELLSAVSFSRLRMVVNFIDS